MFEVPGVPQGKGRHRAGKIIAGPRKGMPIQRADPKSVAYEAVILTFARQAMGRHGVSEPLAGPLWMRVATFRLPANPVERKWLKEHPQQNMPDVKKPDWDNLGKVVSDALNGVVYADDCAIADGSVVKWVVASGIARIVVSIGLLTDDAVVCQTGIA